jgi:tRNA pseudouridine55 synthase
MQAQLPHREGIIVVDKPAGPTSFDVVFKLRRSLGEKSIGHCGTLDPLASGVVVVCVGRYTKLVRLLTSDDKRYVAEVSFGHSTPSLDKETEPDVFGDPSVVNADAIRSALAPMRGVVSQVPPLHSALQKDGVRLYHQARAGKDVTVDARDVVVHDLELLSFADNVATIACHVGKGFFVRSLARDLGTAVGCPAHLSGLRRTQSGGYTLDDAVALDVAKVPDGAVPALKTGRAAIRGVAQVEVTPEQAHSIRRGFRPLTDLPLQRDVLACCGDEIVAVVDVKDDVGEDPAKEARGIDVSAGEHRLVSVRGF